MLNSKLQNGLLYVGLLIFLVVLTATTWGYIAIAFYTQTGFMALLSGFLFGLVCGLFIRKNNRGYFILGCLVAALISVNLGVYISFAYIEKNFLIEESVSKPFFTSLTTLLAISLKRYFSFIEYLSEQGSLKTWFWHGLSIVAALYQVRNSAKIKSRFFRFKKFLLSSKN